MGVPAGQGIPKGVHRPVGLIGEAHGKVVEAQPRVHRHPRESPGGAPVNAVEVECGSGEGVGAGRGRCFRAGGQGRRCRRAWAEKMPCGPHHWPPQPTSPSEIRA